MKEVKGIWYAGRGKDGAMAELDAAGEATRETVYYRGSWRVQIPLRPGNKIKVISHGGPLFLKKTRLRHPVVLPVS